MAKLHEREPCVRAGRHDALGGDEAVFGLEGDLNAPCPLGGAGSRDDVFYRTLDRPGAIYFFDTGMGGRPACAPAPVVIPLRTPAGLRRLRLPCTIGVGAARRARHAPW